MAIRLRPLGADDLDLVWRELLAEDARSSRPPRPGAKRRLRARLERSGRFSHGLLELGIEEDGRLVGTIQARRPEHGLPPGVVELGIGLFEGERGRGVGREAVAQFVDLLVRRHRTHRIQATTWVGNVAMRRVLELLGWRLEGVMRDFMPARDGELDDYALYAITKSDLDLSGA